LWALLGTKLNMSTAFHPQSDGQTERVNRVLEEMLRAYVSFEQNDWHQHLGAAEIAINSGKHASTGYSPFYLNHGFEPSLPLDRALRLATDLQSTNASAADRVAKLQRDLERARDNLKHAQEQQAKYADQHRRAVSYKVGDQVWLSSEHLNIGPERSKKLEHRYYGPYPIVKQVNPVS